MFNGIGIDFESIKIVFFCGCFQNIEHFTNDRTLIEFHLEIYDNTATPKKQKYLIILPVQSLLGSSRACTRAIVDDKNS